MTAEGAEQGYKGGEMELVKLLAVGWAAMAAVVDACQRPQAQRRAERPERVGSPSHQAFVGAPSCRRGASGVPVVNGLICCLLRSGVGRGRAAAAPGDLREAQGRGALSEVRQVIGASVIVSI